MSPWLWRPEAPPGASSVGPKSSSKGLPLGQRGISLGTRYVSPWLRRPWLRRPEVLAGGPPNGKATMKKWKMLVGKWEVFVQHIKNWKWIDRLNICFCLLFTFWICFRCVCKMCWGFFFPCVCVFWHVLYVFKFVFRMCTLEFILDKMIHWVKRVIM